MRQYERSGVTVDQCTECRGIFLDRGELERLIDAEQAWQGRPAPAASPAPAAASPAPPAGQPRYREYDSDEYPMYGHTGHTGYGRGHHKRKKRRSFLEELFD